MLYFHFYPTNIECEKNLSSTLTTRFLTSIYITPYCTTEDWKNGVDKAEWFISSYLISDVLFRPIGKLASKELLIFLRQNVKLTFHNFFTHYRKTLFLLLLHHFNYNQQVYRFFILLWVYTSNSKHSWEWTVEKCDQTLIKYKKPPQAKGRNNMFHKNGTRILRGDKYIFILYIKYITFGVKKFIGHTVSYNFSISDVCFRRVFSDVLS